MAGAAIAASALVGAGTAAASGKLKHHHGRKVAAASTTIPPVVAEMQPRAEMAGTVESVYLFHESLGSIHAQLDPESTLGTGLTARTDESVEVVVMRGNFEDHQAHMPHWASPPLGTVMAFVVDPDKHLPVEVYVGDRFPTVQQPASYSRLIPVAAKTSRVHARVASRHHKSVAKAATWGSKCSYSGNHHCYALSTWKMSASEYIYGSETVQDTSEMYVPDWEQGDFVDATTVCVSPRIHPGTTQETFTSEAMGIAHEPPIRVP